METAISGPSRVRRLNRTAAISETLGACTQARLEGRDPRDPAPQPTAIPADWRESWFIFSVADVSDETAAKITKAGAWPAFTAFFRLLWKRQREAHKAGRTKAEDACRAGVLLGEGIKGLARSIGISPKAMDRQVAELHSLGILAVSKPPASIAKDAKGRIVRRPAHKGLVPASKIRFNAGDEHKRPKNQQGSNRPLKVVRAETSQGSDRPLKGGRFKGRSDTSPRSPVSISPSAGGHAVGNGRPADAHRTRPTAGEAPQLRPWTGPEETARLAMLRRLEADKAAQAAREAEARAALAKEPPAPSTPPRDAAEAAGRLAAAVAELPEASRQKAKRVAKRMTKADRQAAKEAQALKEVIERKRQAERDGQAADAKAVAEKAKEISRKARQAMREPVAAGPL